MKDENSCSEEYQIKQLLKYRIRKGVEQLLIYWEGYSKAQSTWQPFKHINPFPGLTQEYQQLKSEYQKKRRPKLNKKKITLSQDQEQSSRQMDNQSQIQQYAISTRRPKKIRKAIRATRNSKIFFQSSDNRSQQLQDKSQNSQAQLQENQSSIREQSLQQILNRAPSIKFSIRIPVAKDIPYSGQKLKCINKCFKYEKLFLYEVEIESQNIRQPIILSENYIRILWPRQFAQYLLEKTVIQ